MTIYKTCPDCGFEAKSKGGYKGHVAKYHTPIPPGQNCEYGCGQPARFLITRTTTWCCGESKYDCPENSPVYPRQCPHCDWTANNKSTYAEHVKSHTVIPVGQMCDFGCGQPARYYTNRSKLHRCSENLNHCPGHQARLSEIHGERSPAEEAERAMKNHRTFLANRGVDTAGMTDDQINAAYSELMATTLNGLSAEKKAEIQANREATYLRTLGVRNPQQKEQIVNKRKKTLSEKSQEEWDRILTQRDKTAKRLKTYRFPSGREVKVQGYEPKVLDGLLKAGIHEADIVVDRKAMPVLKWHDAEGHQRRYFPDIFLPRYGLMLEVKSNWTFGQHKDANLRKRQAVLAAGYGFRFVIR